MLARVVYLIGYVSEALARVACRLEISTEVLARVVCGIGYALDTNALFGRDGPRLACE